MPDVQNKECSLGLEATVVALLLLHCAVAVVMVLQLQFLQQQLADLKGSSFTEGTWLDIASSWFRLCTSMQKLWVERAQFVLHCILLDPKVNKALGAAFQLQTKRLRATLKLPACECVLGVLRHLLESSRIQSATMRRTRLAQQLEQSIIFWVNMVQL